jgi:hypothetical protein
LQCHHYLMINFWSRQGNEEMCNQLAAIRTELTSREEEKSQMARALNEMQISLEVNRQTLGSAEHELEFYKEVKSITLI